jgi:uncharacterized protein YacL
MTDTLRAPRLRRVDAEHPEHVDVGSASISDLISQVAGDVSELVRKEVELAKAEATTEAKKAAKAAGMFGGAGFAGYMVAVFATITAMAALAIAIPLWAAALVVTAMWAIVGAVLALRGRAEMRRVRALPKTTASLKEDAEWARHPVS